MNLQSITAEIETRGQIRFQGLTIRIENPRDSVRKGVDRQTGRKWSTQMTYDYGFIKGTTGVDGAEVDCFVGPDTDAKLVHVIHILNPNTGELDEDKVMLGWKDSREAKDALLENYDSDDLTFYGGMDSMSMDEFKRKVTAAKTSPTLIRASKLDSQISMHAKVEEKKITIGDQVIVDGMRGQIGEVIGIKGRRYTVRFRNGLSLSRDQAYVRLYGTIIPGMWKDQHMNAGGQGSGCTGPNCGRPAGVTTYHGTSVENAYEILRSGMKARPVPKDSGVTVPGGKALFTTTDREMALGYALHHKDEHVALVVMRKSAPLDQHPGNRTYYVSPKDLGAKHISHVEVYNYKALDKGSISGKYPKPVKVLKTV